jgi:O-antigen/teichoic acid export membrane protein
MSIDSNKRLAKNTLALYFRTIITLLVSLYTSRVILDVLGITDFGVYSLVGSIVLFFSFLSNTLSNATQRILTFELGRSNFSELKRIFSMSLTSIISLALIIFFLAETFGRWFINNKLNIPVERLNAASWTYQLSIITFCLEIIRTPYRATIISYEKLSFFAYLSIFEALLKLGIVLLMQFGDCDKLILYSSLLMMSSAIINIIYLAYCNRKFEICNYKIFWDKKLYIELISFSGWNLLGSSANVATQNGLVYIINIFFGVALNASLGIANQVNSAFLNFVGGFQTSFAPQIVKLYSQNNKGELFRMITMTSKLSYMLVFIPAFILMLNMTLILKIWLYNVPPYTIDFCIWILVVTIFDATTGPYYSAIMATGDIKRYQFAISISFILDLVFTYVIVKAGLSPSWIFVSRLATRGILNMLIGLFYLNSQLGFEVRNYFMKVLVPILVSLILIIPIPFIIMVYEVGWCRLFYSSLATICIGFFVFYKVLLTKREQLFVLNIIKVSSKKCQRSIM